MAAAASALRRSHQFVRIAVALLLPVLAMGLQQAVWPVVRPFAWFLFYPAVFISSWLGGLRVGLVATAASAAMAWYWFIPPLATWLKPEAKALPVMMFLGMGVLFSVFNGRLRHANRQLQGANAEVTRLYERTRELDELKTQFFANVSHELRTPLTLVLGPAERLLAAPDSTDAARADLDVIVRNARALLRRVSELLDASKLEAGRMRPAYADTDLARLTRLTASHFETIAQERRLRFEVLTPSELRAQVDPEQMMRVLLNLLSNAFKFTPEGGRVRMTVRAAADRVQLEVADSGPGIPPEQRDAVFERFRQAQGGATRPYGGTGLGLAIARDLVQLHAGRLTVADAPEGGALFLVDVPRTAPAGQTVQPIALEGTLSEVEKAVVEDLAIQPRPAPATAESAADVAGTLAIGPGAVAPVAGRTNGGLVLVVEDNSDMNRFVCQSLQADHRIAAAFDGTEGLRLALELEPDLVLTDAMMPGVGGEQLVTAIRRERTLDTTPVLMLTAKADDAFRVHMLRSGARDFMIKPFQVDELRARVANLISAKRALDDRARLAALVESADDAIVMHSLDGKVLTWNPGAERIYGYTAQEMLGQPVFRLVPPEQLPEVGELVARIRRGERVETSQTTRLRKDGSTVPIAFTLSPVFGPTGAVIAASAISRDISDRFAAEEALRASEAKFAGIVSIASDAIVSMDDKHRIVLYNHGAERMFGWAADEVLGKPHDMLIPERFRGAHPSQVQDFAGEGAESRPIGSHAEITGLRKNGEEFPAEAAISKLVSGQQRLFTKVLRDTTERKRAEAERERLITELQAALAHVRTLSGLLPICAWCKKVRDDAGYWQQIEGYLTEHTAATFSHGICPACKAKLETEGVEE